MSLIHIKLDGTFEAVAAAHPNAARIKELKTQITQAKKDVRVSKSIETAKARLIAIRSKLADLRSAGKKSSRAYARAVEKRDEAKAKIEKLKGQLSNPRYANMNRVQRHYDRLVDQLAAAKKPVAKKATTPRKASIDVAGKRAAGQAITKEQLAEVKVELAATKKQVAALKRIDVLKRKRTSASGAAKERIKTQIDTLRTIHDLSPQSTVAAAIKKVAKLEKIVQASKVQRTRKAPNKTGIKVSVKATPSKTEHVSKPSTKSEAPVVKPEAQAPQHPTPAQKETHKIPGGDTITVGDRVFAKVGLQEIIGTVEGFATYWGSTKAVVLTNDWHDDGSSDTVHAPLSVIQKL